MTELKAKKTTLKCTLPVTGKRKIGCAKTIAREIAIVLIVAVLTACSMGLDTYPPPQTRLTR
jgi:hypothetical protein